MIYLPKQVCLIIIHRNTTHILDTSCCHKHQQQRYHYENTKICMFIHYMYVDILFPLTKVIPIISEGVTTHYQTLQTWIGHNTTRFHNLNILPLLYIFSHFSMVWGLSATSYHALRSNLFKKCISIFFLKNCLILYIADY